MPRLDAFQAPPPSSGDPNSGKGDLNWWSRVLMDTADQPKSFTASVYHNIQRILAPYSEKHHTKSDHFAFTTALVNIASDVLKETEKRCGSKGLEEEYFDAEFTEQLRNLHEKYRPFTGLGEHPLHEPAKAYQDDEQTLIPEAAFQPSVVNEGVVSTDSEVPAVPIINSSQPPAPAASKRTETGSSSKPGINHLQQSTTVIKDQLNHGRKKDGGSQPVARKNHMHHKGDNAATRKKKQGADVQDIPPKDTKILPLHQQPPIKSQQTKSVATSYTKMPIFSKMPIASKQLSESTPTSDKEDKQNVEPPEAYPSPRSQSPEDISASNETHSARTTGLSELFGGKSQSSTDPTTPIKSNNISKASKQTIKDTAEGERSAPKRPAESILARPEKRRRADSDTANTTKSDDDSEEDDSSADDSSADDNSADDNSADQNDAVQPARIDENMNQRPKSKGSVTRREISSMRKQATEDLESRKHLMPDKKMGKKIVADLKSMLRDDQEFKTKADWEAYKFPFLLFSSRGLIHIAESWGSYMASVHHERTNMKHEDSKYAELHSDMQDICRALDKISTAHGKGISHTVLQWKAMLQSVKAKDAYIKTLEEISESSVSRMKAVVEMINQDRATCLPANMHQVAAGPGYTVKYMVNKLFEDIYRNHTASIAIKPKTRARQARFIEDLVGCLGEGALAFSCIPTFATAVNSISIDTMKRTLEVVKKETRITEIMEILETDFVTPITTQQTLDPGRLKAYKELIVQANAITPNNRKDTVQSAIFMGWRSFQDLEDEEWAGEIEM